MSFRTVYSEPEYDMQGSSKSDSEPDDDALTLKWSAKSSSNSTSVIRFPGRKVYASYTSDTFPYFELFLPKS